MWDSFKYQKMSISVLDAHTFGINKDIFSIGVMKVGCIKKKYASPLTFKLDIYDLIGVKTYSRDSTLYHS